MTDVLFSSCLICRENGSDINDSDANEDLKRKYAEATPEVSSPFKSPQKDQGDQAPTPHGRNPYKQQKRGKLDWNVLRPPKPQNS